MGRFGSVLNNAAAESSNSTSSTSCVAEPEYLIAVGATDYLAEVPGLIDLVDTR